MKFSELVNFRNHLNAMSSRPSRDAANLELGQITHLVNTQHKLLGQLGQDLLTKQVVIQQSFNEFEQCLDQLKTLIKEKTEIAEKSWFQDSYTLYESLPLTGGTSEYILNRRPNITEKIENFYRSRIMKYTNWHYPAMIIRPGTESFIKDMVAYDPLYLIDEKHELLTPALNMFNKVYQRRLRTYVVNERADEEILNKLPNGQFGMCLAYNYFNYLPFEVLKRYLIEIYQKLKPGGVLAMTFNDCDRVSAVRLVENKFCSYTPGYLVRELAQSLGYEIEFSWNDPGPSTWIEFKKPGNFDSLKGGQALAKIMVDEEILFENDKKIARKLGILDSDPELYERVQQFKNDRKLAIEFGIEGIDNMTPGELQQLLIARQEFENDKKLAIAFGIDGFERMTPEELQQVIIKRSPFEDDKRLAAQHGITVPPDMTPEELRHILSSKIVVIR